MSDPSYDELKAKVAELEKQVQGGRKRGTIDFKVSEKGGVSVYGLGRFPVTLYYEQWIRLLDKADDLRVFLETSHKAGLLKTKDPREEPVEAEGGPPTVAEWKIIEQLGTEGKPLTEELSRKVEYANRTLRNVAK